MKIGKVFVGKDVEAGESIFFESEYDNGSSGTSKAIDWTQGNKQKITLTGDCTFTFTAPEGACNLVLKIIQDSTGEREITWPDTTRWPDGIEPTLSIDGNSVDIVTLYFDGTNYFGQAAYDFKP